MTKTEKICKSPNNSKRKATPIGAKSEKQQILGVSNRTANFVDCLFMLNLLEGRIYIALSAMYKGKRHRKKVKKIMDNEFFDCFYDLKIYIESHMTKSIEKNLIHNDRHEI